MEHLPTWLEAAVNAAGMAVAYNADDWELKLPGAPHPSAIVDPVDDPPGTIH